MKKIFQKLFLSLMILSSVIFPVNYIAADGMMIRPDDDDWTYYSEKAQDAIISYENGRQTMILSVGTEILQSDLVWIFPVPAKPEDVTIDNSLKKSPNFYGEDIMKTAEKNVNDMEFAYAINEVLPLIATPLILLTVPPTISDLVMSPNMVGGYGMADYKTDTTTIFEHIENNGMVSELITTTSTNALQKYFDDKNLEISADQLNSIKSYIGKDFSFVVSWISDNSFLPESIQIPISNTFNKITSPLDLTTYRGLMVSFPTDKIFFPLIPTSVYESKVIPASVRIIGFVSPETFKNIESYTEVNYYKARGVNNLPDGFSKQLTEDSENFNYTLVKVNAPSKLLTEDLYFNNFVPLNVFLGKIIVDIPIVIFIITLIWNSMLASALSALLIFKEARSKKVFKFALLGLTNLFTFFGLIIVTLIIKTKEIKAEDVPLFDTLKSKGYNLGAYKRLDIRKLPFLIIFILIYFILSIGGAELVKWVLSF